MENGLKLFELMKETLDDLDSRINLLYDRISASTTASNEVKRSLLESLETLNASKARLIGSRDVLLTSFGITVLDPEHPQNSILESVLDKVILEVEKVCGLDILPKEAEVNSTPQVEEKKQEQVKEQEPVKEQEKTQEKKEPKKVQKTEEKKPTAKAKEASKKK